MANKTGIQWCDYSSNPLRAELVDGSGKAGWFCVHASPGCEHCYSETLNRRFGNGLAYTAQNLKRVRFVVNDKELLTWQKLPAGSRVFVGDMLDLFLPEVPDAMIDRIFAAAALRPDVVFQFLTKRAARLLAWATAEGRPSRVMSAQYAVKPFRGAEVAPPLAWPLPNVWLGTSCEDQRRADERIPLLLQCPAAVRFLSCEPLLGPIDLEQVAAGSLCLQNPAHRIDALRGGTWNLGLGFTNHSDIPGTVTWCVVGGESGPGARPCDLAWIRDLVEQCGRAGVACFVKQLGARPMSDCWEDCAPGGKVGPGGASGTRPVPLRDHKGGTKEEWPPDLRVRRFPAARPAQGDPSEGE